jgi:hypothetical protein
MTGVDPKNFKLISLVKILSVNTDPKHLPEHPPPPPLTMRTEMINVVILLKSRQALPDFAQH